MGKAVIYTLGLKKPERVGSPSYFLSGYIHGSTLTWDSVFLVFTPAIVAQYSLFGIMYLEHFLFFLYSCSLNLS